MSAVVQLFRVRKTRSQGRDDRLIAVIDQELEKLSGVEEKYVGSRTSRGLFAWVYRMGTHVQVNTSVASVVDLLEHAYGGTYDVVPTAFQRGRTRQYTVTITPKN